jgi:hypothetical protein
MTADRDTWTTRAHEAYKASPPDLWRNVWYYLARAAICALVEIAKAVSESTIEQEKP